MSNLGNFGNFCERNIFSEFKREFRNWFAELWFPRKKKSLKTTNLSFFFPKLANFMNFEIISRTSKIPIFLLNFHLIFAYNINFLKVGCENKSIILLINFYNNNSEANVLSVDPSHSLRLQKGPLPPQELPHESLLHRKQDQGLFFAYEVLIIYLCYIFYSQ